jgi:hypothetical protein
MCYPFWVKTHPDILAADPDVPVMQSMIGGVIIIILFATVLGAIWFGVGSRRGGRPYYYR